MAFGPDGLLYVGTGESGERPDAQDPNSLGGKILRLTPDLRRHRAIRSRDVAVRLHLRPPQRAGPRFDDSGRLWASEFGQNTWDELNLIAAGGNYGWPEVEGQGARDGFIDPQRVWPTDEASPSGIAFWHGLDLDGRPARRTAVADPDLTDSDAGPTDRRTDRRT